MMAPGDVLGAIIEGENLSLVYSGMTEKVSFS